MVQGQGKTSLKVYRPIPNSRSQGRSGLSIGANAAVIRGTRHVSHISAQQVFMSFGRADTDGATRSRRRPSVQQEAPQNFGYRRASDSQ
jgi:hypothetical protein